MKWGTPPKKRPTEGVWQLCLGGGEGWGSAVAGWACLGGRAFCRSCFSCQKNMREDRKRKCFVWGCQPGPGALTHLPPAAPAGQWLAPLGPAWPAAPPWPPGHPHLRSRDFCCHLQRMGGLRGCLGGVLGPPGSSSLGSGPLGLPPAFLGREMPTSPTPHPIAGRVLSRGVV